MEIFEFALFEEVVYSSEILPNTTITELIDLIYDTIKELSIVRYNHYRSIELLQSRFEDILRAHIHVVGRLIEHQQIVRFEHHPRHCQARTLTTRQDLNLLVDILATEQKSTQNITQTSTNIAYGNPIERIIDRKVAIHQIVLILSVVADTDICSNLDCTLRRLQLPNQHTGKGCLSLTIATNESNFIALVYGELCALEYSVIAKDFAHLFHLGNNLTGAWCRWELYIQRCQILLFDLDTLQLVELLDA